MLVYSRNSFKSLDTLLSKKWTCGWKFNGKMLGSCWITTDLARLRKYLTRPGCTGYAGHEISFASCWATFHEAIRLFRVTGWDYVSQTGSYLMYSPSMLILMEMCMFALLVSSFQIRKLNWLHDVHSRGIF